MVTTTYKVFKEGTTDMVDKNIKTKPNVVEEAITPPISEKNKIDKVNKTKRSQASNKTVNTHRNNKTGINQGLLE